MRGLPTPVLATPFLLFLFAGTLVISPAAGQTAPEEPTGTTAKAVRTLSPADFHETFKARMSGGLSQQLPFRMIKDSQGRIFVTEPQLSLIQVFDPKQSKRWQIIGTREQRLVFPMYIAVDAKDNIYVTDPGQSAILVYQPDGHFLRTLGHESLDVPFGLAIDKTTQLLYVSDCLRGEIQVYALDGKLRRVISQNGTGPEDLNGPRDIVLHHGMIFVLDSGNSRFQIFDVDGASKGSWPFGNDRVPVAFAFDAAGNFYIVDLRSRGMLITDPDGKAVAALDPQLLYGQPGKVTPFPNFMGLAQDLDGSVLALRPELTIDVVKLEKTTPAKPNAEATPPESSDAPKPNAEPAVEAPDGAQTPRAAEPISKP